MQKKKNSHSTLLSFFLFHRSSYYSSFIRYVADFMFCFFSCFPSSECQRRPYKNKDYPPPARPPSSLPSCSPSSHARGHSGSRGPFQLKQVAYGFSKAPENGGRCLFWFYFEGGRWLAMWCKASHERRRRLSIDLTWLADSVEESNIKGVAVGTNFFFLHVVITQQEKAE